MLSKNIRGRWTTSSKLEAMLQKSISNTTKSTDEVISTPIPWCNLCHRSPQLRSQINCSWTFQSEVLATFLGMHWRSASTQKGAKKKVPRGNLARSKIFSLRPMKRGICIHWKIIFLTCIGQFVLKTWFNSLCSWFTFSSC